MKTPSTSRVESMSLEVRVDTGLLRRQHMLLTRITDLAHRKLPYVPGPKDEHLLEGLLNLADVMADAAEFSSPDKRESRPTNRG